ncbi:phytoene desaturase family protein [Humibacillus xanthopallidus]|uniref:Phytoene dehydrogenase-like protein n=1 Tax=Humibacillus xanthopallidus TaxID=412689 RepID=A0A543HGM5_9MICO|nr:NAD(P)/FAD-dependent oxidoreductase [Humibacillus xanthopallidus]TQM57485.1 phytoene dehydrogenase-like protein [Humibacillus xanthopallidus]
MHYDDVIIGAGHNGLTAAAYLARAGRSVLVLERSDHVGGAAVSARAFSGVDARLSRYSYLVSLLPRQILTDLDLDLRLIRRRYSSYTPVPSDPDRGLLVDNVDEAGTRSAFRALTGSDAAHTGWTDFYGRMTRLAERVFPTVLTPLRSHADVRALVDDDELFDALTSRPLGELIESVTTDDTLRGIIATDALIGTFASLGERDLRQNICFLYHLIGGGTGDWDVPIGGMGALTDSLAAAAVSAGATILTGAEVTSVDPSTGEVAWAGGTAGRGHATGSTIVAGCAPAVLNRLLAAAGAQPIATEADVEGAQLKVNMLLTRLPRLRDATAEPAAAFAGTFHINEGYAQLERAYAAAADGRIPDLPPCEIYCHTLSDRSILGPELAVSDAQTLTLFGLHLPARLFRADNETATRVALEATLRSLDSVLAEPISDVVARDAAGEPCIEVKSPVDLEQSVGLPGGNIFHRSLQWPWAEQDAEVGTWGVETAYGNVLLAGAGARRGGGVSGIPGHNAARALLS